jgi:hypothetical protein
VRLDLPGDLGADPLALRRRPGQTVASLGGQLPGVEIGMDQRGGLELRQMVGGPPPLSEQRLEGDDRADRLLGEFGLMMGGLAGGDLGVDPRKLAPQGAGGNGRCAHARQTQAPRGSSDQVRDAAGVQVW